ncbi:choice-of-anchor D domain-containing protein [Flavobacterium litorale]|uniref:Choice-of-anchor D domain-containing protein n=1 Tax=Flavobacterium litorale TaxID=2856519 RepID=A0ABX8V4H9_9FLAO|nr:choice-of-anchor D domain-containing protein [Flavobacterium litorale]QYJ67743.1 choice-of-anchor D domain-containing protein [Flavobacterium litorale]
MFKKRFLLALAVAGITGLSFGNLSTTKDLVSAKTTATTVACTGGGSESFTNLGSSSSAYTTRTWIGDNSVEWEATDARTDQDLNGDAIAIRTGSLTNTTTITGGVGTLTFNYARVFSGNSTLQIFVNGVQYGADIDVTETTITAASQAINVSGNITIEIRNSGNRTIIDDLSWDCSDAPAPTPAPELQLADACSTDQACGDYTIDFGSVDVNEYKDAVFTVKNNGNDDLNVTALTMSNADFTIISPSVPFTVGASESALVLVRFESATGGAKAGTLTIANNDADEASCVVNLAGIAVGPCVAPAIADEIILSNATSSSVDVEMQNSVADNYIAIISNAELLSGPVDGVTYTVGDAIDTGVVAYIGDSPTFTVSDLEEDSDYFVTVYAFNSLNCTGGPLYATDGGFDEFTTLVAPCIGANENFDNTGANQSNYTTRTWTGNNGVEWEATDARTDQDLNGEAIAIRTGSLTNTTPVTGGMGTLTFNYARVFTGNSTLKVFVNGVQYGADITVSDETATQYSVAVDVSGDITLEIENSGNRTIVDDVQWDCYTAPNAPEIQLLDSELSNQECGNFNLDFGNVETGVDNELTFTIQNRGLLDLEINDLLLSDDVNYTIVSPVSTTFVLSSNATQDVTVRFNSATEAAYPATLTVESDDADESLCVVNLNANAQDACVAPDADGTMTLSNITDTSADVAITGNGTASGFIALVILSDNGLGVAGTPVNGTAYVVGDVLGDATVAYVGTSASFTISDLAASSTNPIYVYAYNDTNCFGGPVYSSTNIEDEITTNAAPCTGGNETFDNLGSSSSSYSTRTWTGNDGIVWTANDARTDRDLNGDAIAVRTGTLTNVTTITGGVGTLTFNYARVFSGNSTLKVFVNGVQYGGDITVSSTSATQFSEVINVTGDVTIEIENSVRRTIIDDIQWDCYALSARPGSPIAEETTTTQNNNFFQTTTTNKDVVLYPNPNNGEFQIELPAVDAAAQVEVFDTLGKQVLTKRVVGSETINLENAGKGIYMVVVTAGNNVTTKKVVIK